MSELKLVTLLSRDVAAARDFYVKALGAKVIEDKSPEFVKLRIGSFAFCIDKGTPAAGEPKLLFEANPLQDEVKRFAGLAITFHKEPQGALHRRWFSVLDPDGHEIIFGEKI